MRTDFKPISAGNLDQYVTLQRAVTTRDAVGGFVLTWTSLRSVWMGISPEIATEPIREDRPQGETQYRCFARYDADILASDRVLWGTKVLEIVGPPMDIDGRGRNLEFFCREVA